MAGGVPRPSDKSRLVACGPKKHIVPRCFTTAPRPARQGGVGTRRCAQIHVPMEFTITRHLYLPTCIYLPTGTYLQATAYQIDRQAHICRHLTSRHLLNTYRHLPSGTNRYRQVPLGGTSSLRMHPPHCEVSERETEYFLRRLES